MKKDLLTKTLVLVIFILFIGVGIYPAIATESISSNNIYQKEEVKQIEDIDQKEFLFQTIIEISNNPDVRDLFKRIEDEWKNNNAISLNYNCRNDFLKTLFKKPKILISTLFTRPSFTQKYLNLIHNNGFEIVNLFGEDKSLDIIESATITNHEVFNQLNNIIMNNEELSDKIATLAEMNEELKPDLPFEDYPIICALLFFLGAIVIVKLVIYLGLLIIMPGKLLWGFLSGMYAINIGQLLLVVFLLQMFTCISIS